MAEPHGPGARRGTLSAEKKALLARRLEGAASRLEAVDHIPRRRGTGPARLSFGQERLWLLDRLDPGGVSYVIPYAYRIDGGLDVDSLRRAFHEIVRRHDILRTTFRDAGDHPVSQVASPGAMDIPLIDIAEQDENSRDAAVLAITRREARTPFDLQAGPLLRVSILRTAPARHVLLLTLHHIVFDGWSERIFFEELRELYSAYAGGRSASLAALPVQYADFAEWQRDHAEGDEFRHQIAHWREVLAGAPPLLELPPDRPRPSRQSFRGVTHLFRFSRELLDGLVLLGRAEGTTLFMTVLAAFNVFLAKYAGRTDIVVGTPMAGRTVRDSEPLIGFFVNTLVIRTDLSGDPTFREVLRRTKGVSLKSFDHQDVPFERIVAELRPQRDLAYGPLIQVLFVLQTASGGDPTLPGVNITRIDRDTESAKFDLTLSMTGRSDGIEGWMEGNADIFDASTVARMVAHFEELLRGVVSVPEARVSGLRLLPEAELGRMVEEWGGTEGTYPRGAGIVRVFAEVARGRGGATALSCGGVTMSYGELDRRSAQCARYLRGRGVRPGSVVGLSVERSFELIVGMLGILKAGGAYCPLEESNPDARLASMMKEGRVSTVVTMSSQAGRLRSLGAEVVCLDSGWGEIGREEETDPVAEVTGSSLAYAMYTSGSTGQPKCVGIPHDAVVRLVRGVTYVHLGPEEVLLQYAPASFDASTFEIWGALLNGGKLVIMPAGRYSLEEVGGVVQSEGVTTLWLTAALFHHMVDGPVEFFGGVRQLLAGGEVLSVGHVQKFARRYPGCTVINGYGPTENTTFTCCYTVKDPEGLGGSVPIGRPVNATHVYILDGHLQPVPVGVPGELYIGGDGLATGYLHQPSLTAERFVADPYRPGERMYRSGDRVRYLADGNIEFLGRMDAQVKLRGYRIEPGEIETVLAEEATVKESVVLVREETSGEKSLVAYLTARPGRTIVREAVEKFARSRLPEYMVPAGWVVLGRFPVTPNGKIDRNSLPAPVIEPGAMSSGDEGNANPTENAIAQIWSRLLPGRTIDRKRSFFEQGGHSLLAMQLASRIMEVFQIKLSLVTLFEHATIPSLALIIEEKLTEEFENTDDGGSPVPGDHP